MKLWIIFITILIFFDISFGVAADTDTAFQAQWKTGLMRLERERCEGARYLQYPAAVPRIEIIQDRERPGKDRHAL